MIPQITEVNFPSYATLHQATVSLQEMGDRTITTQVRIDGSIVPEFNGWELVFNGERFILPVREPQATKDNTTRNSLIDLTFYSWPVYQMKRFFFAEMTAINSSTAIADKYKASLNVNLEAFVDDFNDVLNYYFGGSVVMDLFQYGQGIYNTDPVFVEIDYSYIWDVLQKVYELYNVRWYIIYDSQNDIYYIKVGYTQPGIADHDFEYGYKGGLLKFERQLQDDNVVNILLGRGGEKNLPYRYFKKTDPGNPEWTEDPDAIPELANIYFDRLRDVNFRWYVRGWMRNSHRDHSWDSTHTFPTYTDSDCPPDYFFAYQRGKSDDKFNPVEFVKDDDSITKYGEHWGALEDNDDIYPTIQGIEVSPYGRIDEAVDVSQIVTDDMDAYAENTSVERTLNDVSISLSWNNTTTHTLLSDTFVIPTGETGNVTYTPFSKDTMNPAHVFVDTLNTTVVAVDDSGTEHAISGLSAGTYRLKVTLVIRIESPASYAVGTFGISNIVIKTSNGSAEGWKPTFDIWVKNIWGTTQNSGESDEDYSYRVWSKILGDRVGSEAKIAFSTGPMAAAEDYEFTIASYPMPDSSKSISTYVNGVRTTVPSHWRITLYKSDAEFDATGLYIPNAQSPQPSGGDHFFFLGIDMPFQYVIWAEERLNAYKTDNLDEKADVNPTWVISIDKVRCNTLEGEEYGATLAEQLATGGTIRIKDDRFTGGQTLVLYVQSIKYTWNEPSQNKPYLVPDIEIVLSDKVIATMGPVGKMQSEIKAISSSYVRGEDVEAAIRQVAGSLFLKKTGEADKSASPTRFANKVTSANFRPGGVGGRGWGLYEDNARSYDVGTVMSPSRARRAAATRAAGDEESEEQDNKAVFEVDKLIVRDEMQVNTLVVNQISYQGGKEIISAAEIEVTMVVETDTTYDCYFDQKQNSVENLFVQNDIAYGQVWEPDNTELRYYKCLVTGIGLNYISLSKTVKDGQGVPQKGDVIVQYGNTTNTSRQYVIVRDVIGGGYERMLCNLNSVDATGKEYYFAGRANGDTDRWFVGDSLGEYAEWHNGQLNIKGRILVHKNDNTYASLDTYLQYVDNLEYLYEATNEGTLINGGLILSSLMQLGKTETVSGQQQFVVYSGINGIMDTTARGDGIAAWYGGPMVDHEASSGAVSYAKSLFRFDGSGYLASGNIGWDSSGNGHIPGITWSGNDIIIGGNVKLQSLSGDSVTDLINAVTELSDLFEIVTINNTEVVHVKRNRPLYTDSWISAGGIGSGGGGGGGGLIETVYTWSQLQSMTTAPNDDATSAFNARSVYQIYQAVLDLQQHSHSQAIIVNITTSQDGTVDFVWSDNEITRLDLNHAHSGYVPITRQINGHSLSSDITLSATTDLGVASWAMDSGSTGSTVPFNRLPSMYIGKTPVKDNDTNNDTLIGISGFTTAASASLSGDDSLVVWEPDAGGTGIGAWHFKGNLYADGWVSAGGIGSGGGGGVAALSEMVDVNHNANGVLRADGTAVQAGDALVYNTTMSKWVAAVIQSSGGTITDVTLGGTSVVSNNVAVLPAYPTTLPASDVYSWAKASTKPSYSFGELTSHPSTISGYGITIVANDIPDISGTYVTLATTQNNISGAKTFTASNTDFTHNISVGGTVSVAGKDMIDLTQSGMTMFGYGARAERTFNAYGTVVNLRVCDSNGDQVNILSVQNGVILAGSKIIPNYLTGLDLGGSSDNQRWSTIYGVDANLKGNLTLTQSSSIFNIGPARIIYDSSCNAIRITSNDGSTMGFYADGFVSAGGQAASLTSNIVFTDAAQTINSEKTFTTRTVFSGTNLGDSSYGIDALCDSKFTNIYATGNITASGKIGVGGSPSNSYALYVTGSQSMTGSLTVGGDATITSGLGVGTAWAGNSNKLVVSGTAIANAWNTSSDRRLKKDIVPIGGDEAVEVVMALNPSTWTWKEDGKKGAGLVAQEVESVLPFMVCDGEYKSLNYQMLHAYELSAIQNHETRIQKLESAYASR